MNADDGKRCTYVSLSSAVGEAREKLAAFDRLRTNGWHIEGLRLNG